jgi:cellulose synthase/poly-beta-1,6-N-acetylglucosamine synthase-like glycosyltransferase
MPECSETHLVLIPTYNTGDKVLETVRGALAKWNPVWVVVDGSDDGTGEALEEMAKREDALRVIPVQPCGWNDLGTADRVARCVDRLPGEATWRPSVGPVVHLEATLALCTRI